MSWWTVQWWTAAHLSRPQGSPPWKHLCECIRHRSISPINISPSTTHGQLPAASWPPPVCWLHLFLHCILLTHGIKSQAQNGVSMPETSYQHSQKYIKLSDWKREPLFVLNDMGCSHSWDVVLAWALLCGAQKAGCNGPWKASAPGQPDTDFGVCVRQSWTDQGSQSSNTRCSPSCGCAQYDASLRNILRYREGRGGVSSGPLGGLSLGPMYEIEAWWVWGHSF